jgi:hypothetical protein
MHYLINSYGGKNMRKSNVICIFLCILVTAPAFSITAAADSDTKFITAVYGSLPFPLPQNESFPDLIHSAGGIFFNIGNVPAKNVSCSLRITGITNPAINKTMWYNVSELPAKKSTGFFIEGTHGFGFVNIILTISASNAETTIRIAKGFQIGRFTWIPLSWIAPGIFQYILPWFNGHPTQ